MRITFASRLIIIALLVQLVTSALLIWNSERLINSSHSQILGAHIKNEVDLLAYALTPGLAYNDRATLQDALLLIDSDYLRYAVVYNHDGEPMATIGNFDSGTAIDKQYSDALTDQVFDIKRTIILSGQTLGTLRAGFSISALNSITAKTRYQNSVLALTAIVISSTLIILVGIVLTRRLRMLGQGAQALRREEFFHRIHMPGKDDVAELANTFNELAQHLENNRTALSQEHAALERETNRLNTLLNGINAVVWEADTQSGRITHINLAAESILGYRIAQWQDIEFLVHMVHPDDRDWLQHLLTKQYQHQDSFSIDHRLIDNTGKLLWMRHICMIEAGPTGINSIRGIMIDITENKQSEQRVVYLAEHDSLTGLVNRHKFQTEVSRQIEYARRYQQTCALLFVDLDQFKYVNDSYGHQAGDQLLIEVARCLATCLRETDVFGRLGGDEFGIILPIATLTDAIAVAEHLLQSLAKQNLVVNKQLSTHISASIGIAMIPDDGMTPSDLLAKADTAMYRAKDRGRNRYYVYTDQDAALEKMHAKIRWEDRIRQALANNQFVFHYQPIYFLDNGTLSHYEVLLRMIDADGSLLLPSAFIDTAERFGLIDEIDRWVVRGVLAQQAQLQQQNKAITMAINISARHFRDRNFLDFIREQLTLHSIDPAYLIFEVTETAAVENLNHAHEFIASLKALGCRFSLDDFGMGFSSLHYLKNLPVDIVKVDGGFVRHLVHDQADRTFVRAITEMANALGMITVAEFVESAEIAHILRQLGVHMGQGFYLGKPAEHLDSPITFIFPEK